MDVDMSRVQKRDLAPPGSRSPAGAAAVCSVQLFHTPSWEKEVFVKTGKRDGKAKKTWQVSSVECTATACFSILPFLCVQCLPSLTRSLAPTPLKQINNFIMK